MSKLITALISFLLGVLVAIALHSCVVGLSKSIGIKLFKDKQFTEQFKADLSRGIASGLIN